MKKEIALVLSGGGARGIAHIGAIEELLKRNYTISSIAGTSMGAVVGGIYALGKLKEFKDWLITLDKVKVFNLVDFTFSAQGLIKGDKVLNTIKEFTGEGNIEALSVPFAAIATDIANGKEVVFTSGSLFDAIRASIAIPTVLTPVSSNGSLLVDGGVLNNLPVNRVKRHDGDILVAVNVNADIPYTKKDPIKTVQEKKQESVYLKKWKEFNEHVQKYLHREEKPGYFTLINNTIQLMISQNAQLNLRQHTPDIMIETSREACSTFDFFKAQELIEMGREAAIKALAASEKIA